MAGLLTAPETVRLGPNPRAKRVLEGGDWPHTGRILPWMLAGFLAMLFLIPFDSIDFNFTLPFDSKLDRIFLMLILVMWIVGLVGAGVAGPRLRRNPMAPVVLLFLAVAGLSLAVNLPLIVGTGALSLATKKIFLLVAYVLFFFVVATVVRPSEVRNFTILFVGLATVTAIGILWEYRTNYNPFFDLSDKLIPGATVANNGITVDIAGRRQIAGPMSHGLAATTLLTFAFPFAVLGVLQSSIRRDKLLYSLSAMLLMAGAFSTARKTAVFVPAATVVVMFAYRPRHMLRLAPLGLLIVPFIWLAAPNALGSIRDQLFPTQGFFGQASVKGRTQDYDAVKPDIRSHLVLGRGFGTYDAEKFRLLDNQYLGLLIETGVLGTACFLLMVVMAVWTAHPVIRSGDPIRGPPALACAAAAVGFGLACLLFDALAFAQVPYAFMFLAALVSVTSVSVPAGAPPPRPPPVAKAPPLELVEGFDAAERLKSYGRAGQADQRRERTAVAGTLLARAGDRRP